MASADEASDGAWSVAGAAADLDHLAVGVQDDRGLGRERDVELVRLGMAERDQLGDLVVQDVVLVLRQGHTETGQEQIERDGGRLAGLLLSQPALDREHGSVLPFQFVRRLL
jgi:hypothetical protein